jgi:hypothetical protein
MFEQKLAAPDGGNDSTTIFHPRHLGCQIFLGTKHQNWKKYTKTGKCVYTK